MYHRGKKNSSVVFLLFLAGIHSLSAQLSHTIMLNNPSFEDAPATGRPPSGWFNCGFAGESPPDVQPGSFSVSRKAQHGNTYLGMVVRDNESWEKVGQQLSSPLLRGKCYEMTIQLCHSDTYWSMSQMTRRSTNYDTPVVLRVWGGNGYCILTEQLAETSPIDHTDWRAYTLKLSPMLSNYTHITFEAYYKKGSLFAYNGNLLSDNASYIREIACPPPPPVVAQRTSKNRTAAPTNSPATTAPPVVNRTPVTAKEVSVQPEAVAPLQPIVVAPAARTVVRTELIQTKILYFDINEFIVPEQYDDYLRTLAEQLKNFAVAVEAGGHTNNKAADKFAVELSEKRAKAVADRLIELGAPPEKVSFKGYGKSRPLDSNLVEEGREKNQRVEITIWKIQN